MNSEVKVGILFFLGLGLLLWFTIFTTQIGAAKGPYAVIFPRVTRLKEGDGVTYNGVKVGTVTEVIPVLLNDGKPAVKVSFSINGDRKKVVMIDEQTEFRIAQGLLGGSSLEIAARSGVPARKHSMRSGIWVRQCAIRSRALSIFLVSMVISRWEQIMNILDSDSRWRQERGAIFP